VLTERKQQLLAEISAEEKLLAAASNTDGGAAHGEETGTQGQGQGQGGQAQGCADVDDSLDAFMSTMTKVLEGDKVGVGGGGRGRMEYRCAGQMVPNRWFACFSTLFIDWIAFASDVDTPA
jgi:hypothetical protein